MTRGLPLLFVVLALACAGDRPDAGPRAATRAPAAPAARARHAPDAAGPIARPGDAAADGATSCDARLERVSRAIDAVQAPRGCQWSVDCVLVPAVTRCGARGALLVASSGVVEARAALARIDATECEGFERDGCRPGPAVGPTPFACVEGTCASVEPSWAPPPTTVPPQNEARLAAPPPRPPAGDADSRARRLFDAIVADDPPRAMDFFFPREAFLVLKGIEDAGGYHDRLLARYVEDIHALHASTPDLDRAEFLRLELARRGGWVGVSEEANRLPYWASRHSSIVFRVGEEERRLEVRVLITWGERWYITHLSEFRTNASTPAR